MGNPFGVQHLILAKQPPHSCSFFLDRHGENEKEKIVLSDVVRWVPGKRMVARGRWHGKDVYAKLFWGSLRSRSAWEHEIQSYDVMADNSIAAPEVILSGSSGNGKVFVLLMKQIEPAKTLDELWFDCVSLSEIQKLINKMMAVLANHHQACLVQRDIHWDNFLCKGETIYTLDAGNLAFLNDPLGAREREENLSQFFSLLNHDEDELINDAVLFYNGLFPTQKHVSSTHIRAITKKKRFKKIRKYTSKKIFRSCTEFYLKRSPRQLVVCDRNYLNDVESFLYNPNLSLASPGTVMLKEGNACTVWSVRTATNKYVVKRYNIKSTPHGIGRLFRPTNGAHSWRAAHLLRGYGILTPRPVALVENRFGPCRSTAYFITEHITGLNFWDYFFDPSISMEEKKLHAQKTRDLFVLLQKTGIKHGDMKGQNLMLTSAGIALIDLDDVRQYSLSFLVKYWHKRDIKRFMRNWQDHPILNKMFSNVLQHRA